MGPKERYMAAYSHQEVQLRATDFECANISSYNSLGLGPRQWQEWWVGNLGELFSEEKFMQIPVLQEQNQKEQMLWVAVLYDHFFIEQV